MKKETRQTGFTLVELLVTMTVMIIVLAVGIPWYGNLTAKNRIVAQVNMFVGAVNVAKSTAISIGEPVSLCSCQLVSGTCQADSDNKYTCGANTDWVNGWFVYPELEATSGKVAATSVIQIWQELEGNPSVTASIDILTFRSTGEKSATSSDTFEINQTGVTGQARCVQVSPTGLISRKKGNCS